MGDKRSLWLFISVIVLAVVALVGGGRINSQLVDQGMMSEELVIHWVAARELVINGNSPYQPEVTRKILTIIDSAGTPDAWRSSQFTSPIYALFLILPVALIADLGTAQVVWMSIQQTLVVVMTLLSIHLFKTKPGRGVFVLMIVTTFLGYHFLAPVMSGSTIILAGAFLLLGLVALQSSRDEIAGIFLGLTTIQGPFLLLPVLLVLLWSFAHRRRLVVVWFAGIVVIMTVLGIFLVPDWPGQYLRIIVRPGLFFPASSPGAAFRVWWPGIGGMLAWILTALTAGVMLIEWSFAMRAEFRWLTWAVCLTLVLSNWSGLPANPENLVLLILPLILCVGVWSERWGLIGKSVAIVSLISIFVWEWWLVSGTLDQARMVDRLTLLLPMPSICLIGLYWVRWMFVRPKRQYMEDLRSLENP